MRETDRRKPETPLQLGASGTDSWLSFACLPARRGHFSFAALHVTPGCWSGFPGREFHFSER